MIRHEELKRIENERTVEKKSRLLRTASKNEDQTMDHRNGPEAKISKRETGTTLTMDLRETPPPLIKTSPPDQTSHLGTTIRTIEDHMINAQITHSIETNEIDLKVDLSTIRMETGEIMELFRLLHRLKERLLTKKFIPPTKKRST